MTNMEIEIIPMTTMPDDDGGVSVNDEYSFPPGFDYDSEITATVESLSALVAAKNHVELAKDVAYELRVIEAAAVLKEAWIDHKFNQTFTSEDVFRVLGRALLNAVEEGLV